MTARKRLASAKEQRTRPQRAGRRTRAKRPIAGNGFVVICDIVAFSEKPEAEQVSCIAFLNGEVEKARRELKLGSKVYINSTGDGFLAVIRLGVDQNPHKVTLRFCEMVLASCTRYTCHPDTPGPLRVLSVRFGIHKGDYQAQVAAFGGTHTIGRAPNHAARVVTIGDSGHIVVSEDFFAYGQGAPWARRFSEPNEVSVKHGRLAKVRFYRGGGANDRVPRRIQLIEKIGEATKTILVALHNTLVKLLHDVTSQRVVCRVTIFVPSPDGLLRPTYRYDDTRLAKPGQTAYATNPPKGAVGLAFSERKPQFVADLPDAGVSMDAYCDAWMRRGEFRLLKADIEGWGMHPRAVIAVPFAIGTAAEDVQGVLCVDTLHSLAEIKDSLQGIADALGETAGKQLPWTILLRRMA
jgi:class 3 adenylate cyclase